MKGKQETIKETGCELCPRLCRTDRGRGERGYCGMDEEVTAARAALHMWEEPCISGEEGSGTIFFSGCSLQCVFCQNAAIASGRAGRNISVKRLAEIFLELQEKGANNINLVTPTHYAQKILEALCMAKKRGLRIPIIYNSSGYERVEILRMLEGSVDIYLPDMKYMDDNLSKRYSHAQDYAFYAKRALKEMVRQTGTAEFDERGMMIRGVIVRHLVLPGCVKDSKQIVKYLYDTYGDQIYLSIMNQYTPVNIVHEFPELNRNVTEEEYNEVVDYAIAIGVENGFIQEGDTAKESFIPAFDGEGMD